MLHSMTGFARESADAEIGALTWEIRAVNHRYLDVQFRLPEEMRPHEQAFRQELTLTLVLTPFALWLGRTGYERLMLIACLLLVLIVELLNSAIEAAVDRFGDVRRRFAPSLAAFVDLPGGKFEEAGIDSIGQAP